MIYDVIVCGCGYRMFNLTQKRGATRPAIKALRRAAKENHCRVHIGLMKCPSCGTKIEPAETRITMNSGDSDSINRAAQATSDLLKG